MCDIIFNKENYMSESTGQINRGSSFGEILYSMAIRPDVNNIVEIGTWNGMGSTRCIIEGIIDSGRTTYNFLSFESNVEMYERAKYNIESYLSTIKSDINLMLSKSVNLYNGTLISDFEFPEFDQSSMVREWYDEDIKWSSVGGNLFHLIPPVIDFLLIDGGEYTGRLEYKKLKDRCNIIALDDVRLYKCVTVRESLMNDEDFICLFDNINDRNGYSVFVRKNWI